MDARKSLSLTISLVSMLAIWWFGYLLGAMVAGRSPVYLCGTIETNGEKHPVGVGVIDEMSFELRSPGKIVLHRKTGPCPGMTK